MPHESRTQLRTSDLNEAIAAVSRVYCPHEVKVVGKDRGVTSVLEAYSSFAPSLVRLRYSAPVDIDAGDFRNLVLMMTCTDGSAVASQGAGQASWRSGQTLPLSANVAGSCLAFDARFAQSSIRFDLEHLEALCARRLNHPLDRPLRFELCPFSDKLERAWQGAMEAVAGYARSGVQLPPTAARSLEEFMMSLVLDLHPHNYSADLRGPHALATPRVIREAERMMREKLDCTVSDVASALGISVRSLEAGFQEWRQTTPTKWLRQVRLEAAHRALSQPTESTSVSSVALEHGFVHLARFSAYYRAAFNEYPSQTLSRHRIKKP